MLLPKLSRDNSIATCRARWSSSELWRVNSIDSPYDALAGIFVCDGMVQFSLSKMIFVVVLVVQLFSGKKRLTKF
jgi:hypothetical protein